MTPSIFTQIWRLFHAVTLIAVVIGAAGGAAFGFEGGVPGVMGTPVHTPDGRSVFVISSIPDPSYVVVESEAAISINLINVDLDPEKVQDPLLYSIEIADASSGEHETIHPDAVSFRRRALKIPNRTNDLEIGSHVFLLFERPFEIGTTYRLSIVPEAGLPGATVTFTFDPRVNVSENIRVNQVGYLTDFPKYALVGQYAGTRGPLPLDLDAFSLIDADTGETVYSGTAELVRSLDFETGQKVYKLDFTEVRAEGTYRVFVPEIGISYPFRIASDALNPVGAILMRGLVTQRSAYDGLTPQFTRFSRPAGHVDDAYLHPASESVFRPQNPPHYTTDYEQLQHLPTARGHHDAGDYGKYTVNGAHFVHYLLEALTLRPETAASDNLSLPFSGNGIPDVLEEAKWALDWLENMQDPLDGGVFSLIKPSERFRYETNMPQPISGRWIYPKDTVPTAAYAAALAHAARHPLVNQYYPEDAIRYLEKAKRAWAWLEANDRHVNFHHYGQTWGDADERVWAAVELYLATGEEAYHNYFLVNHKPHERRWGWVHLLEAYGNATRSYILNTTRETSPGMLSATRLALKRAADEYLYNSMWRRAYGLSMEEDPIRNQSYGWYFPTASHAYDLIVAYEVFGDPRYLETALANMNYELGANPQSYVQITGLGSKRVTDIVDQLHLYGDVDEPRVGVPVGAGSSEIYRLAKYGDAPIEATYPARYPVLARFYNGWNVHSEVTIDKWARILGSYLYFFEAKAAQNQLPVVEASYHIDADDPQLVHFSVDASDVDGTITSVYWDFGDGNWAVGEEVSHRFAARPVGSQGPAERSVFVRVIDNDGGVAFQTIAVELP